MTGYLKTLILALAAVLAMSAATASAAFAQGKLTSDGPVTLIAEETGGAGSNAITAFGLKVECPGSIGTGHKYTVEAETTHEEKTGVKAHNLLVPNGSTTFTVTPHINDSNHNCKVPGTNFVLTTDFNGCDYVVHIGATTGGANTYSGTTDIVCPPGKEIMWTAFTTAAIHTSGPPFCVFHIPPQNGLTGGHATNTGGGTIDLAGTVTGLIVRRTASATHPILCPESTTSNAMLDGDGTVRGINAEGASTAISLSD